MTRITTEDLIGSASLIEELSFEFDEPKISVIKEKFLTLKHSDKKVLTISFIALVMGMYRP